MAAAVVAVEVAVEEVVEEAEVAVANHMERGLKVTITIKKPQVFTNHHLETSTLII